MYRYSIWILKYILIFIKNIVNLLLLSGATLGGELTSCYSIPGMFRLNHDQCEYMSMVDELLCLFSRYHCNRWCRLSLWYAIPLVSYFDNHLLRLLLITSVSIP